MNVVERLVRRALGELGVEGVALDGTAYKPGEGVLFRFRAPGIGGFEILFRDNNSIYIRGLRSRLASHLLYTLRRHKLFSWRPNT